MQANDLKFEKFVKGKKFKQCSKCQFWVEKNQVIFPIKRNR